MVDEGAKEIDVNHLVALSRGRDQLFKLNELLDGQEVLRINHSLLSNRIHHKLIVIGSLIHQVINPIPNPKLTLQSFIEFNKVNITLIILFLLLLQYLRTRQLKRLKLLFGYDVLIGSRIVHWDRVQVVEEHEAVYWYGED